MDEAEDFVTELIQKKLDEFKISENALSKTNYKRLENLSRDLSTNLQYLLETQIKDLSRKSDSHFNTQDEIINLVSIEIGKDSKKKSDIIIKLDELQGCCDRL